ncbi:hypothetical protein CLV56_1473 [Mumia flava]|uniref:Uncharacterized protein n=2 Tax=Mumia flava TaxID=1348852 RepID=A0A2M9BH23_9ACTN|nr:hypothetical protein CLV56_1473 [Mumia flava]
MFPAVLGVTMFDAAAPDDDPGDDIYDDRISRLPDEPKPKRDVFTGKSGRRAPKPTTERDVDDLGSGARRG